jgi:hypothetical protein
MPSLTNFILSLLAQAGSGMVFLISAGHLAKVK